MLYKGTRSERCIVECTFGSLKRRFPCLQTGLRMNPKRACTVIVACLILHNVAVNRNLPEFQGPLMDDEMDDEDESDADHSGQQLRDRVAHQHFR